MIGKSVKAIRERREALDKKVGGQAVLIRRQLKSLNFFRGVTLNPHNRSGHVDQPGVFDRA